MSANTSRDTVTAACLTPPVAGGIAVVQVIGQDVPALLIPLLQARRPLDVQLLAPESLRFCRIVHRGEILDDAVIAARKTPDGVFIVELNLHGGPRIVQRVLLALKEAGATVVDPSEHVERCWPADNILQREALQLLSQAKTRAVAGWLARAPALLKAEIERIDSALSAGGLEAARRAITELLDGFHQSQYLLSGIRIVLTGKPNSGKSTLANALAGSEHSIVSDCPGTTRDWVEIPTAMDGIPVTLVDTAGIRSTGEPLEQESIRRAERQIETADVVLEVIDSSGQWHERSLQSIDPVQSGRPCLRRTCIRVWNKSDLLPAKQPASSSYELTSAGLLVSARTGEGLARLRQRILETVRMADYWGVARPGLFTQRQYRTLRSALQASETDPVDRNLTRNILKELH